MPRAESALAANLEPSLDKEFLTLVLRYRTNAGAPSSVTPNFIGEELFDTSNSVWYRAFGTVAGEWSLLGESGLSAAEIAVLDGVTAGTVTASKAVVPDSNKDIASFRNLRTTRTIHAEGAAKSVTADTTLTAAETLGGVVVCDPSGADKTITLPTAALLVAAVPNAAVGDIIDLLVVNGADANENVIIAAGSGGGFDTNQTSASRKVAQNASKTIRIRLTNVTASSEAYVVYA